MAFADRCGPFEDLEAPTSAASAAHRPRLPLRLPSRLGSPQWRPSVPCTPSERLPSSGRTRSVGQDRGGTAPDTSEVFHGVTFGLKANRIGEGGEGRQF